METFLKLEYITRATRADRFPYRRDARKDYFPASRPQRPGLSNKVVSMSDEFVGIPGLEHLYEINRAGVVRAKARTKMVRSPYGAPRHVNVPMRIVPAWSDATNRPRVQLYEGDKRHTVYIHNLLALTFGVKDE